MGIQASARRRSTIQQRNSMRPDGNAAINENLNDDFSDSESEQSGKYALHCKHFLKSINFYLTQAAYYDLAWYKKVDF